MRRMSPSPVLTALCLLLPVLNAQKILVEKEVWGYVGHMEVILPCHFVPGPENGHVNQVQWDLKEANSTQGDKTIRLLVHDVSGGRTDIPNDQYLNKVEVKEYSLVIKNVDLDDAGVYTCALTTFPSGSFSAETTLFISDQMPLSAGVVSAIVISVLLLLGITAAAVYLAVMRRCPPSSGNHITIDTTGWDPSRPSFMKREDVLYSDVSVVKASKQKRVNPPEDHVTYSEVKVNRTKPEETLYSHVMKI